MAYFITFTITFSVNPYGFPHKDETCTYSSKRILMFPLKRLKRLFTIISTFKLCYCKTAKIAPSVFLYGLPLNKVSLL